MRRIDKVRLELELEEHIEIRLPKENILDVMTNNLEQWQHNQNILGQMEKDFRRKNI